MPTTEPLTFRQGEVLAFIVTFTAREKWSPTRREISDHFGWRTINAAETHVKVLVKKGYLKVRDGAWHAHRNIQVV